MSLGLKWDREPNIGHKGVGFEIEFGCSKNLGFESFGLKWV